MWLRTGCPTCIVLLTNKDLIVHNLLKKWHSVNINIDFLRSNLVLLQYLSDSPTAKSKALVD